MATTFLRSILRPDILRAQPIRAAAAPFSVSADLVISTATPTIHRTLSISSTKNKSGHPCGPGSICDHTEEKKCLKNNH
ncbi:hypothetical protein BGX24_004961 [Mortierella sp. AD032]|nr:hypothetical protein BGX24_004961 [Mortierella sp. AD032]